MKISSAFPSNYLRASDLQNRSVAVTMDRVVMEDISGGEMKPVLYFQGKEKGVVLNKTNANNIAVLYGDDTDGWQGQRVELYPTWVDFQGRSVEAIRIRRVTEQANGQAKPTTDAPPPADKEPAAAAQFDDEIPF